MLFITLLHLASSCSYTKDFTLCSNNKRSVLLTPQNCPNSTVHFLSDLPCSTPCPAGTFLDIKPNSNLPYCTSCDSGTFSIGGGLLLNTWNLKKNPLFVYCWVLLPAGWTFDSECTSWHSSEDEFLVSGRSSSNHWYETSISFFANIVKEGSIHITYRKESLVHSEADPGEFMIYVDGFLQFMDSSEEVFSWLRIVLPLTIGPHEIEFVFKSFVNDKVNEVQIKEIQIRGTEFASLSCESCESGSSPPGSDKCIECEIGSYLLNSDCVVCPIGTSSLQGSVGVESCFKLTKCGPQDYHLTFSQCLNGKREKIFEWNFPIVCDNDGVDLPGSETVECETCPLGMVLQGDRCEYCETGFYSPTVGASSCFECGSGFFAPKSSFFRDWTSIEESFKVSCATGTLNKCEYSWEPRGSFIESSPFYQENWAVNIQKTVFVSEANAFVRFSYEVLGTAKLQFYIEGVLQPSLNATQKGDLQVSLDQGENQLKWTCLHSRKNSEKCVIYEIVIFGSSEGGAIECVKCSEGSISSGKQEKCTICESGFTSNENNTQCVQCPGNTYSTQSRSCSNCVASLIPDPSHQFCTMPNELKIASKRFSLTKLLGQSGQKSKYCQEPRLELSCYQSFYGPVNNQSDDFYISIGQPSIPTLPTFFSASKNLAYVFGILNKDELTLEEQNFFKPNATCDFDYTRIIVNLGSTVQELTGVESGFRVLYTNGDFCNETHGFESEVEFVCSKRELEGWPVLVNRDQCRFSFMWPTVHACSFCDHSQLVYKKGNCEDGKRTVHVMSNASCVFEDFSVVKETVEHCKSGPVYAKELVIVGSIIGVLMIFSIGLLCYFTVVTKKRYKRLDALEDSASIASEDASPRVPNSVMKKVKEKWSSQPGGAPEENK